MGDAGIVQHGCSSFVDEACCISAARLAKS